jgi:hypothetical protein
MNKIMPTGTWWRSAMLLVSLLQFVFQIASDDQYDHSAEVTWDDFLIDSLHDLLTEAFLQLLEQIGEDVSDQLTSILCPSNVDKVFLLQEVDNLPPCPPAPLKKKQNSCPPAPRKRLKANNKPVALFPVLPAVAPPLRRSLRLSRLPVEGKDKTAAKEKNKLTTTRCSARLKSKALVRYVNMC